MFLGDDLLPLLMLAFGGAMAVGMILALVRPPEGKERPPVARSLTMAGIGAIAALWAIASLVGG
jgi:hypothetical protein